MKIDINQYFTDIIIEYHGKTYTIDFNVTIEGCWVFGNMEKILGKKIF